MRHWLAQELRHLRPLLADSAAHCQAERYRKHFKSFQHGCLLLFHALSGAPSLRQGYEGFQACDALVALSGLQGERGVSLSQYADSNTTRPAAFLGGIISTLARRVAQGESVPLAMPISWRVLDSTFLGLSLKLAPWVRTHRGHGGVFVQVLYTPAWDRPEQLLFSDGKANDYNRFDAGILGDKVQLAALEGDTLVLDLGYYSHERLRRLLEARVHWVTRLHAQAKVQVNEERALPQSLFTSQGQRITLLCDQRISLGSANNRAGAVLPNVRHIQAQVAPQPKAAHQGAQPVCYNLITDRWDLEPLEVVQAYLWRWQIELFFRWLKSHLRITHWLGYSENAVRLTVYLAIVTHLLCLLAQQALGYQQRTPGLLRRLGWALAHLGENIWEQAQAYQLPLPECSSRLNPG
jgi:hypothetical protein